jgi:hypothetical protein
LLEGWNSGAAGSDSGRCEWEDGMISLRFRLTTLWLSVLAVSIGGTASAQVESYPARPVKRTWNPLLQPLASQANEPAGPLGCDDYRSSGVD